MRVIQNFGGAGAHPNESIDECLEPALEFFSVIIKWYFEDYRKSNIPDSIRFRKKKEFEGFPTTGTQVRRLSDIDNDELTVVRKNAPSESSTCISMLEATMSNPRYGSDLKILDGVWDTEQIIGSETIFILTGCHVNAELLDRPIAEMLRDEIDRLGKPSPFRRAIVIGDWWWQQDAVIQAHPLIAVGGPPMNGMTREILAKVEKKEVNGLCTAFVDEQFPKIAIWGELASQTRESVENFIHTNLRNFLNRCWK